MPRRGHGPERGGRPGLGPYVGQPPADPVWSPDGKRIAFHSDRDVLTRLQVYTLNADGTGQTRLTVPPGVNLALDRTAHQPPALLP